MTDNRPSAIQRGVSVIGKLFVGSRKGPTGERARGLRKLQKRIEVRFTDVTLLEQAITHRSYSHVTSQTRNDSNERMEFLGDSVLGLAVSQFLYLKFPDHSEGALSKMKSLLVSRKVLSSIAREIGLGEFLLLSGEEAEMGGRDRASILADSFEGVIGAIYLDQGYRAANKFIQHFLLGNIQDILKDEDHTNFKSLLQEYVQSKRLSHPVYRVRKEEGPEHEKEFAIEVVVKGEVWGVGRGKSKKDAEQNAARAALEKRQGRSGAARAASGAARSAAPESDARSAGGSKAGSSSGGGRSRRRRTEERAEPAVTAKDRGDHGIAASRDKLRATRKERAEDKRRVEKERREQRREAGEADRASSASDVAVAGAAAGVVDETSPSEGRSRSRRGRRGGERTRPEETADASVSEDVTTADSTPVEGEERERPRRRRRRRRGGSRDGAVAATSNSEAESESSNETVDSSAERFEPIEAGAESRAESSELRTEDRREEARIDASAVKPAPVVEREEAPAETGEPPTGFVRRKKRRPGRSGAAAAKTPVAKKDEEPKSDAVTSPDPVAEVPPPTPKPTPTPEPATPASVEEPLAEEPTIEANSDEANSNGRSESNPVTPEEVPEHVVTGGEAEAESPPPAPPERKQFVSRKRRRRS